MSSQKKGTLLIKVPAEKTPFNLTKGGWSHGTNNLFDCHWFFFFFSFFRGNKMFCVLQQIVTLRANAKVCYVFHNKEKYINLEDQKMHFSWKAKTLKTKPRQSCHGVWRIDGIEEKGWFFLFQKKAAALDIRS